MKDKRKVNYTLKKQQKKIKGLKKTKKSNNKKNKKNKKKVEYAINKYENIIYLL